MLIALSLQDTPNQSISPMYMNMENSIPHAGVSTSVYLGDKMLEQRHGQFKECVIPKFDYRKSMNLGLGSFVIRAGEPICKQSQESRTYTPNYINWNPGQSSQTVYNVTLRERRGELNICLTDMGMTAGCTEGRSARDYEFRNVFLYQENTIQRTIEYAGKNGNILSFIYSEFNRGTSVETFTRDFQIDLSEGNVAAYRGALIEIESANNTQITYKVIRNFQQ